MENIAETTGNVFRNISSYIDWLEPEQEQIFFEFEDQAHTFQIGLKTLLECLVFAIEEGELPDIDPSWWNAVCSIYGIRGPLDDVAEEDEESTTTHLKVRGL